jgi:mannose-1-phosphate guanylyltransferase
MSRMKLGTQSQCSDAAVAALVLAAGRGERLRPFTDTTPKPLLPVLDRPLLGLIVRQLTNAGIRRIGISASHLANQIVSFAAAEQKPGDGTLLEVRIEPRPLGPASALRLFEDVVRGADVTVVVSGDVLAALDIASLVDRHLASRATLSVVTKKMPRVSRFGVVDANEQGRVVAWREKPSVPENEVHAVSCGIYAVAAEALDILPSIGIVDFGVNLALPLLERRDRVSAVPLVGYWSDIGSPSALRDANLAAILGMTGIRELDRIALGHQPALDHRQNSGRTIGPVFVGERAELDRCRVVGPAVIGAGSTVGRGALIQHSVLLPGAFIDPDCIVVGALVPGRL